jgi:hypothetical protein
VHLPETDPDPDPDVYLSAPDAAAFTDAVADVHLPEAHSDAYASPGPDVEPSATASFADSDLVDLGAAGPGGHAHAERDGH